MKTNSTLLIIMFLTLLGCNEKNKSVTDKSNNDLEAISKTENTTTNFAAIENIQWTLTVLEGNTVHKINDEDQEIHFILNSDGNRVSGFSGCNNFMGTYTLDNENGIKFSQMASTRKACPVAAIDESELLNVLEMTDSFTLKDGTLTLNNKKIKALAQFKNSELNKEPIVEKYWKLKTLSGKDVTMAKNQEREIYFTLKGHNNSVVGFAGCNGMSGEYALEKGNRIRFKNMAVTMKACPDVNINEVEFLKVFELVDNYTINKDVLSLNIGKRAPLAVFEAVYMQ